MQQFRADSGTGFVTAAIAASGCSMQFVLPNRTPLPATREAGLVQIAKALNEAAICTRSRLVLVNADLDGDSSNALGEIRQSLPFRRLVVRGMPLWKPTATRTATK